MFSSVSVICFAMCFGTMAPLSPKVRLLAALSSSAVLLPSTRSRKALSSSFSFSSSSSVLSSPPLSPLPSSPQSPLLQPLSEVPLLPSLVFLRFSRSSSRLICSESALIFLSVSLYLFVSSSENSGNSLLSTSSRRFSISVTRLFLSSLSSLIVLIAFNPF